ncbi:hypothetical protein ISS05_00580 [Candidatus Woesearchaeota archaeon]|nr:hypothetical protein [Candidatus Woesearchaeota archaeon]
MKKSHIALSLIIIFLVSCTTIPNIQEEQQEETEKSLDISETTDVSGVGAMDKELDTASLDTLGEDLEYIENI